MLILNFIDEELWVDELCVWSIMYLENCGLMNCVVGLLCVWEIVGR